MKKILSLLTAAMMIFALTACGNSTSTTQSSPDEASNSETPKTVTVTAVDANSESVEVTVPYDPQRIVAVDLASLDIIDSLGLGDRVVGAVDTSNLDYLNDYSENEDIVNVGTVKEVDFEKIMACEPDVIFMGGRMAANYETLSEIAPTIRLITDAESGVFESTRSHANLVASIFGKESEVDSLFTDYETKIAELQKFAEDKNAVIGMCTSGSFNVLGNGGRCSLIGVEVGFDNLCKDQSSERSGSKDKSSSSSESSSKSSSSAESTTEKRSDSSASVSGSDSAHGSESSFELIVSLDPDYIFVMDRDAATGNSASQPAKEIMENELVMSTDAYKNGNMIILEHPSVWYTAEGGVTALGVMISDLETALLS